MFTPLDCSDGCRANYRPSADGSEAVCPGCHKRVDIGADIVPHLDEGETIGILADTVGYWRS